MADRVASSKWSAFMRDSYVKRRIPVGGTIDVKKLEETARQKLKDRQDAFLYAFGSAGTSSTCDANLVEFTKWRIIPRMLRDVTMRNLEASTSSACLSHTLLNQDSAPQTTIFGVKYPSPLFLSPIGVQTLYHADGELASAAAAAQVGVPFIMSTASTRSIEAVAKASGSGPRWYQLYWPVSPDLTLSLISRAKANGFSALVITLDTMLLGWRPHDLDTAYLPFFHGVGTQIGFTDPVFMAKHGLQPFPEDDAPSFPYDPEEMERRIKAGDETLKQRAYLGVKYMGETASGVFRSWDDLKFIRDNWDGPLILKGILSVERLQWTMALMESSCLITASGRQVDGAVPALYALEQIMKSPRVKEAQASGKLTILFDSGIRTGSDVFKAIALGAQGILYARPYIYGLIVGGQAGVENVLRSVLADTEITLGLSGYESLQQIHGKADKVMVKLG
uniref:Lactate 2-monooxygenase n=1 Tax=Sparassis latifolia TaxID=1202976 RepID=A0A6B9M2S8_9APHY|nr:lactate 2-monooxygenase [Sparassis latifolia]